MCGGLWCTWLWRLLTQNLAGNFCGNRKQIFEMPKASFKSENQNSKLMRKKKEVKRKIVYHSLCASLLFFHLFTNETLHRYFSRILVTYTAGTFTKQQDFTNSCSERAFSVTASGSKSIIKLSSEGLATIVTYFLPT